MKGALNNLSKNIDANEGCFYVKKLFSGYLQTEIAGRRPAKRLHFLLEFWPVFVTKKWYILVYGFLHAAVHIFLSVRLFPC